MCVLAGLYTVRIVAGSVATGIPLSMWLLAFSIFFFLSLAAVKRQAELVDNVKQGKLKVSGRGYHVDDLPIISMISISAGYVAVLVMALYVNSPAVIQLYAHSEALWGVCAIMLYWITRTVMLTHRGWMHDDPVVYAAKGSDQPSLFSDHSRPCLGGSCPLTLRVLVLRYAAFAVIATIANLCVQRLVFSQGQRRIDLRLSRWDRDACGSGYQIHAR